MAVAGLMYWLHKFEVPRSVAIAAQMVAGLIVLLRWHAPVRMAKNRRTPLDSIWQSECLLIHSEMTHAEKIADFVSKAGYEDISASARLQLKIRVLDALGCAIGAGGSNTMHAILAQINEFWRSRSMHADRRRKDRSGLGRAL